MKKNTTNKQLVIAKKDTSPSIMMALGEFTNVIVGAKQSNSEYVISDGTINPDSFVPDHYHKWEDQTFHVIEGDLEAKIGDEIFQITVGDTIHCPRGISHYIKNNGTEKARLLSYIFPGNWAEAFFAETSRQNKEGKQDFELIEKEFGVVYL